jgi:hypothetical protein
MWTICFVLFHPAIHKFNQTLTWPVTSSSAVQAAARLHFRDNNFTEDSFTPIHPLQTLSIRQWQREREREREREKERVKGTPEFL